MSTLHFALLAAATNPREWRRRFPFIASTREVAGAGVAEPPLQLQLFDDAVVNALGARCLDGSPAGYYYREGAERSSFVFFLEGGGLCVEPIDCLRRAKTDLGSSANWSQTWTDNSNVLSANATWNLLFANWTHVFVPYCSGDVYVGTQMEKNDMGLYFAGHNTLVAVVAALAARPSSALVGASRVLLSGGSAGGIGVFQNADWLGGAIRALSPSTPLAYRAAPQAGAYFVNADVVEFAQLISLPVLDPIGKSRSVRRASLARTLTLYLSAYPFLVLSHTHAVSCIAALPHTHTHTRALTLRARADFAAVASAYLVDFFGGDGKGKGGSAPFMDASCVAAHASTPHQCWSTAVHYPYIATPLFVAQNMFDSNQAGSIFGVDWWPLPADKAEHAAARAKYIAYFGNQTRRGIGDAVNATAKDALWMPSCWQHTGDLCMRGGPAIRGLRMGGALQEWWLSRGSAERVWIDSCGDALLPCNAECDC